MLRGKPTEPGEQVHGSSLLGLVLYLMRLPTADWHRSQEPREEGQRRLAFSMGHQTPSWTCRLSLPHTDFPCRAWPQQSGMGKTGHLPFPLTLFLENPVLSRALSICPKEYSEPCSSPHIMTNSLTPLLQGSSFPFLPLKVTIKILPSYKSTQRGAFHS